jgi:hypothetical protein
MTVDQMAVSRPGTDSYDEGCGRIIAEKNAKCLRKTLTEGMGRCEGNIHLKQRHSLVDLFQGLLHIF